MSVAENLPDVSDVPSVPDSQEDLPIDIVDIDLQALADEVYALLKRELRLERDRNGGIV